MKDELAATTSVSAMFSVALTLIMIHFLTQVSNKIIGKSLRPFVTATKTVERGDMIFMLNWSLSPISTAALCLNTSAIKESSL